MNLDARLPAAGPGAPPLPPPVARTRDFIPSPRTIEDSGIRRKVLEDLALKILHLSGELSLRDLAERMHIRCASSTRFLAGFARRGCVW